MFKLGDKVKYYEKNEDFFPVDRGEVIGLSPDKFVIQSGDKPSYVANINQLRRDYTHISPSALKTFETKPSEFYYKYIARHRAPSIAQNIPMAVGSSFDAYIKHDLMKALNHSKCPVFEELYCSQVEQQNRETVRPYGEYLLAEYKRLGAYSDLMLEMSNGEAEPNFEFDLKGLIKCDTVGVPLAGKPDLGFVNALGANVILDFKVNGYCSRSKTSPKKHYAMDRISPNYRNPYKHAMIETVKGINVNIAANIETIDEDWATQICTYGWLMGRAVGGEFIAAIEQLACSYNPEQSQRPVIRAVSYRGYISREYQFKVFERYKKCYLALTEQFFPDLTPVDNHIKCWDLEQSAKMFHSNSNDTKENWFDNMSRGAE